MLCPNCHRDDLAENDIYCPYCGIDVKTFNQVKKYSGSKLDIVSQYTAPGNSAIKLTPDIISDFQKLLQEIHDLSDVPHKYELMNNRMQSLNTSFNQIDQYLKNLYKQEKDVTDQLDKLQKTSFNSIFSKINGSKDQKIESYTNKQKVLSDRIKEFEKKVKEQQEELNTVSKEFSELEKLNNHLDSDKEAFERLLNEATEGTKNPALINLESEYNSLNQDKLKLEKKLQQSQMIFQDLNSASFYLTESLSQFNTTCVSVNTNNGLHYARSWNDSDSFIKGESNFVSSLRFINLIKNIDTELSNSNIIGPKIDEFYSILKKEEFLSFKFLDVCHSLVILQQTVDIVKNTCLAIEQTVSSTKDSLMTVKSKIDDLHNSLINERTEMIQKAISDKS